MPLIEEISALRKAIEASAPTIAGDLVKVLKQLQARPELVHMLDENQIGAIVSGLMSTKCLELPATSKKAKPSAKVSKTMDGNLDL